jgi:hypothetical protein
MIIYLNPAPPRRGGTARRIFIRRDATNPRINGPATLPLFCLAPHGVFPAIPLTRDAVSSYLAFSTLPALCCQRTGGVFSATLSVTAILQLRRPRILRGMLPYGVRTFLWRILRFTSDHLPSARNLSQTRSKKRTADYSPRRADNV